MALLIASAPALRKILEGALRQIKQGDEPAIKYDRNDKPFQHLDLREYL